MRDIFQSAFARTVTVTDADGTRQVRAFLEPESIKSPETPEITAAGVVDGRRWRVILPPMTLHGPVTLTDGSGVYRLLRHERIGSGHHVEAVACREEADPGC